MKMDIVAGSQNDEFYTPEYAVLPILKYLKANSRILCPFDTEQSNFVKILKQKGHYVTATHKDTGCNFFESYVKLPIETQVDQFDYVISNPPYSLKTEVLERLFEVGKPFAMLIGIVGLFESQRRFDMFKNNDFEIMYMNRRVAYFKDYSEQKPSLNPPFSSVYLCKDILPKKIIFEEIIK